MTTTEFNYVLERQSDFLKPYAQSLTKNVEDARDLYQETLYKALVNKDKYQMGTNIKGWLYTIMRNTFINGYRKNKRFMKVSSDVPDDIVMYNADKKAKNSGMVNVRIQEIKKCVEQLPANIRLCFELYYMGYKYQDISSLLNEPLGTVKSRIHFARKMLTAKLER